MTAEVWMSLQDRAGAAHAVQQRRADEQAERRREERRRDIGIALRVWCVKLGIHERPEFGDTEPIRMSPSTTVEAHRFVVDGITFFCTLDRDVFTVFTALEPGVPITDLATLGAVLAQHDRPPTPP